MAASCRRLSADGATALGTLTWDTVLSDVAEAIGGPRKFFLENNGTRALGAGAFSDLILVTNEQVGENDGYLYYETALDDTDTLSRPWGVTVEVEAGTGTWGATGTYAVVVTALNATGETIASLEVEFEIENTTDEAVITWVDVPGAANYKVYRTATPGTYGASSLRATVADPTVTTTDTGSALGAGTPPAANTTGGAAPDYGTAPDAADFDDEDKTVGALAVGQQWPFWARLVVPPGTTSEGNRRVVRITPREIV